MEGISHEAISLAGHLKLGKLTFLYDDNQVTLLDRWGGVLELPRMTKIQVAHAILDRVLALRAAPKPRRTPSR